MPALNSLTYCSSYPIDKLHSQETLSLKEQPLGHHSCQYHSEILGTASQTYPYK